jgi:L-aminopeptidase/D-esterase-like protein
LGHNGLTIRSIVNRILHSPFCILHSAIVGALLMHLRLALLLCLISGSVVAQSKPRARELGIPIGGTAGPLSAITDVPGVEVGYTTLISGSGPLVVGQGPVRTGVTVIHPRGKNNPDPVFGAWFTLNGNGEMTGTTWLQEGGFLEGPIGITNTHSVGVVRDAIIAWQVRHNMLPPGGSLPIVAETYDGGLNDIDGFHVKPEHVFAALDGARSGPVPEGNVGGGTGMTCHGFKGGLGTASRQTGGFTVGVLVQCNCCSRRDLSIAGVPVGLEITDLQPCTASTDSSATGRGGRRCDVGAPPREEELEQADGSIIIVIATDAPLLPHQLKRIATRASLGVGRMGGKGENGSGDIFLAFSTANPHTAYATGTTNLVMLPNERVSALFTATVQATEEAIVNAMLGAETMTGAGFRRVYALPLDRLRQAMSKYGRPLPR